MIRHVSILVTLLCIFAHLWPAQAARTSQRSGTLFLYGSVRDADSDARLLVIGELCTKTAESAVEECKNWRSIFRGVYFVAIPSTHEYRLTIGSDGYRSQEITGQYNKITRTTQRKDLALSVKETWYPLGTSELVPHSVRTTAPGLLYDGKGQKDPTVAFTANDNIIVAWQQGLNEDADIFVRRWNGELWEELSGSASSGDISESGPLGAATDPQIAIDSAENPVVAWKHDAQALVQTTGETRIRVKRAVNDQWEELGALPLNAASKPAMVTLDDGRVAIAYRPDGGAGVAVHLWETDQWVEIGGGIPEAEAPPPSAQIPDRLKKKAAGWIAMTDATESVRVDETVKLKAYQAFVDAAADLIQNGIVTLPSAFTWPVYQQIMDRLNEIVDIPSEPLPTPTWVLSVVKWWIEGNASDQDLLTTIDFTIANGIALPQPGRPIDGWLHEFVFQKTLLWNEGEVSDQEFLEILAMLVQLGVIDAGEPPPIAGEPPPIIEGAPSLATDGENLYLAWRGKVGPASSEIRYAKWEATSQQWTASSTVSDDPETLSEKPSIAVDSGGNPTVAWLEDGFVHVKAFDGVGWTGLIDAKGEVLGGNMEEVQLILDPDEFPSLVMRGRRETSEQLNKDDIYLIKWNGAEWVPLGNSDSGEGISQTPLSARGFTHAYGPDGTPLVIWSLNTEMFAKRWDGEQWNHFGSSPWLEGGVSNSSRNASSINITAKRNNQAAAVWIDTSNGGEPNIYLRSWSRLGWREVSGSASIGGLTPESEWALNPQVKLDRHSRPVIAYLSTTEIGTYSLRMKYFGGVRWANYTDGDNGATLSDDIDVHSYQFSLLPNNAPFFSYSDSNLTTDPTAKLQSRVYTKYWNASNHTWENLPEFNPGVIDVVTDFLSFGPVLSMALDLKGNPVIATAPSVTPGTLTVHRWTGDQWWRLKGPGNNASIAMAPATAPQIAIHKDTIYLAWVQEGAKGTNIHAAAWDDTTSTWSELGVPSGVSDTAANSSAVSLAIDRGFPVVAWQEQAAIGSEIYLRRWDGNTWQELSGSATAGGVSNSAQHSLHPSVAIQPDDNSICISWTEGASFHEIVLRCHRPAPIIP